MPDDPTSPGRSAESGPVILGVPWDCPSRLVLEAADVASALEVPLVCAFVDPASYLVEWEPPAHLPGASLDPAHNDEAAYPAEEVLRKLQHLLSDHEQQWSFRVLNGDVAPALCRLAQSTGASLIIVSGQRPGLLHRIGRVIDESVAGRLQHLQRLPVLVVPRSA